jgi:hypothetical protein
MEMTQERRRPQPPRGFFIKLSAAEADRLCALLFLLEFLLLGVLLVYAAWDLLSGRGLAAWGQQHAFLTWLASVQLFIVGILCLIIARPGREMDRFPWSPFWWLGITLVLVSSGRAMPFLERPGPLNGAQMILLLLALLVIVLVRKAGGVSPLLRLWRCFQGELSIFLAGCWVFLFGTIGIELLHSHYCGPSTLTALQPLIKAFLEVAGASVMLYGALLLLLDQQQPGSCPEP